MRVESSRAASRRSGGRAASPRPPGSGALGESALPLNGFRIYGESRLLTSSPTGLESHGETLRTCCPRRGRGERFCLPTRKGGRRLFLMRRTTSMGVLGCSSRVAGSAAQFNESVSAMPAHPTRTFATPPHPGTADTLLLRWATVARTQ